MDAKEPPIRAPGAFCASPMMCVWHGVGLLEHNSSSMGEICTLLGECLLQEVQLLTVEDRMERFMIIYAHNIGEKSENPLFLEPISYF